LYGVYTFPQVYQMVSTISGELDDETGFYRIMEACFPMGSMTGAPKFKVIELIDQYETSARGIFSGSLGYFHKGDFDFNVVIRSLMYNATEKYLSLKTGSGITIYSDPQKEWEECLVKAAAIKKVLEEPALLR
jgi:para-aminobenzoate synthetase component I